MLASLNRGTWPAMHWTLDDVRWDAFDASRVEPDILRVVKAAALVEGNSGDYVAYLKNVFAGDAEFIAAAEEWGREEAQHGQALAAWAERADPAFDYGAAMARFRAGFNLPLDAAASVRGSRAGELISRCVVECGTSSFYSAIRDAANEPVLKDICHRIAGDEFRHYRLFHKHLRRYAKAEPLSLWRRLKIALGRVSEASDDELSMAYWCGNGAEGEYRRAEAYRAYESRAVRLYRPGHVARLVAMIAKAIDLDPQGRLVAIAQRLAWRFLQLRLRRLTAT
jgi:hypothetical protein